MRAWPRAPGIVRIKPGVTMPFDGPQAPSLSLQAVEGDAVLLRRPSRGPRTSFPLRSLLCPEGFPDYAVLHHRTAEQAGPPEVVGAHRWTFWGWIGVSWAWAGQVNALEHCLHA